MLNKLKLIVTEDVMTPPAFSGSALRVQKQSVAGSDYFVRDVSGRNRTERLWKVECSDDAVVWSEVGLLPILELVDFVAMDKPDNLIVPVGDALQLLTVMLRPRVPVDFSGSSIEYFDQGALLKHLVENVFLYDINAHEWLLVHGKEG